jgi:hypothetical protein
MDDPNITEQLPENFHNPQIRRENLLLKTDTGSFARNKFSLHNLRQKNAGLKPATITDDTCCKNYSMKIFSIYGQRLY